MRRHLAKASLGSDNGTERGVHQTLQGDENARTTVRNGNTSPRTLRPLLRRVRPSTGKNRSPLGREDCPEVPRIR